MQIARASSTLDGLLKFWSVADLKAEFKSEIERLTQVRDEASAKLGIAKTVEEADRIKAEADDYAAKTKGAADAVMVSAASRESDAKVTIEKAAARERAASAQEAKALEMQAEYSKKDGELSQAMKAREFSVSAREDAVSKREAKVAADAAALSERIKRFDEKLASLKATSV